METTKMTTTKTGAPAEKISDLVTGRPAAYRDRFIAEGNDILNKMALAADLRRAGTPLPFRFMVERVEGWNKTRLTKKSNASLYRLIQTEVSRRLGDSDAAKIIAEEVIRRTKAKAMGTECEEAKEDAPNTAFIFGANFNRLIDTVKAGVLTDSRNKENDPAKMISLTFERDESGEQSVTAFTCDGYRVIKTTGKAVVDTKTAFSVYIGIPAIKPKKTDMVSIALSGDIATVDFGNVSFRYKQPAEDVGHRKFKELFDEQEKALTVKAVTHVNPSYLRELARSLERSEADRSPVKIEIQDGKDKLVKLTRGKTEIYLCPMRSR